MSHSLLQEWYKEKPSRDRITVVSTDQYSDILLAREAETWHCSVGTIQSLCDLFFEASSCVTTCMLYSIVFPEVVQPE